MAKGWSLAMRTASRKGYWRERDARLVVEAWRASGRSLEEFATAHGLVARRLSRWARRLDEVGPGVSATGPAAMKLHFHPVELVGGGERPARGGVIEVEGAEGWRVRVPSGFAVEDLDRVLDVLAGRNRC
jgi:hypothetical protein